MPKDHFKKPPTNEEKIANLQAHVKQLYTVCNDINTRLIAICRAKVTAAVLAQFMKDQDANKEFMNELNKTLEAANAKIDDKLKAFIPPEEGK